jgi:hypothetical protein
MGTTISENDLEDLLIGGSWTTAFRLAVQSAYKVGVERQALAAFDAGRPQPPSEYPWWQEWLDMVARFTSQGRTLERVCSLDDPPTLYQRWLQWGDPWHTAVGERIFYLTPSLAAQVGVPMSADWWMFDLQAVAVMRFTDDRELTKIDLLTDASAVRPYIDWRELALHRATPAHGVAAA